MDGSAGYSTSLRGIDVSPGDRVVAADAAVLPIVRERARHKVGTLVSCAVRPLRWRLKRALRRPPHILVDIRWRLGDEIMAIPIYEGIKRRHPFCRLTVWCSFPELLVNNPYVDGAVAADAVPGICDRSIILKGAPRTVFRLEHYARVARIPIPHSTPRLYYDDWTPHSAMVRNATQGDFVAVSTGGTWETKRWPLDDWQSLCAALSSRGVRVIQLGRGDAAIPGVESLVDETSARDAACALRAARLLISSDSGLMHLALAVNTPVLALFGPTAPEMLVRPSPRFHVLTNGRECQGCWNRRPGPLREGICPLNIHPCMATLSVETVLARVQNLLDN